LDGGSARRKGATYTQNNTNRIKAQRDIHVLSEKTAKTVHASDRTATVIGETKILQAVHVYFPIKNMETPSRNTLP
jgi:hypothetical protein